jgi:hypothetical protein
VLRGAGHQLSDPEGIISARRLTAQDGHLRGPDQADQVIGAAAARIVARNPGPAALDLALAGIGFVQAAADDLALTAALDATPGLGRASESEDRVVWQVQVEGIEIDDREVDAASRLHVVSDGVATALAPGPGSRIELDLAAGPAGRTLVLAERSAKGWHASLDGVALNSISQDWAQTFELPAQGGHLEVWYERPWVFWSIQAVVWLLACLVALPTRRYARPGAER